MPKGYKLALSGQKFGRLLVQERVGTKHGQSLWRCLCDCGKATLVIGPHLTHRTHPTKSCGCWAIECTKNRQTTHGKSHTSEFTAWVNMIDRCYNTKRDGYEHYGGRGISVELRWLGSQGVINFLADMGPRPSKDHSLDRIRVNDNYGPSNCRWATKSEQSINRRPIKSLSSFTTEELLTELDRRQSMGKVH